MPPAVYRVPLLIALIAALCVVAGSFGDWARSGDLGIAGLDQDGEATLAAGLASLGGAIAFGLRPGFRELWAGLILAAGAVATALGLDNLAEVNKANDIARGAHSFEFDPAWGLWLTTMGGFLLVLAAASLLLALAAQRRA